MKKTFGSFSFDTASRELRRDGDIVKLQSQPAQVLAVLVEHAGELVTRETLRDAIWGADTFVDFDKGLNFAIAQVRTALGDSAEAPSFIRTFPKRGYQFIAAVGTTSPVVASPESKRRGVSLAVAAVVILGVVLGAFSWKARRATGPAHTIAVARFDNQTGVAGYDRYAQDVTDALVAELTTSGAGRFSIIGNAAVLRTPREQRDIVAIGDTLKAGYIIVGQVQREGPTVRVLAHLIRVPEQTHLWVTRVETVPPAPAPTPAGLARRISTEFLGKL